VTSRKPQPPRKLFMKCKYLFFVLIGFGPVVCFAQQEEVTLEQVVSLALEKNYDVRVARELSKASATDNQYAFGGFLPQLNAVGSTTWNTNDQEIKLRDRVTNEVVTTTGPVSSSNLNASLQLTWTLFDGTRMFATRERIAQLAEQGELSVKNQMVNTIAQVITNYYDVVRQKQQLKATQEQMGVSEERVKLAERKLEVGTGIKPELLQAKVDLNAQRAQVLQQEALISQLKQQLNALVGMQLSTTYDVADTFLIDLNIQQNDSFENLENTNYQLLTARKNVNVSSLAIKERRGEYFPMLNFNAAYTYAVIDNTKILNPYGLLYSNTAGLNYGFTVNIPILGGFNQRRLTQQSRIEFNRQSLLYEQQRVNVNVALLNAFINYENAKKILVLEEETIGAAKENVSIALQTFKAGVTTSVELRIAQQTLAEAYNRLITARYNAKLAETELLRLNGSLLK
jgi:outer membrane protein